MAQEDFKVSCSQVLTGAMQEDLDAVIVIGRYADGRLYVAGSESTETIRKDITDVQDAFEQGNTDVLTGEVAPKAA